jgi:membrane-bound ClpP family serine protease
MILDKFALDNTIIQVLDIHIADVIKKFKNNNCNTDIISYTGDIHPAFIKKFREFIEMVASKDDKPDTLTIVLNTPGGSVNAVEKMVEIIRYHYKIVNFVVPDAAMSAGTIFCMSGDKIYMDYSSSLGPIDPQVYKNDRYVPALGYLDKVEELLDKSRNHTLTDAEFSLLQNLDIAELREYEQAKELSIDLLKKWLVNYKFKNWDKHKTDITKKDKKVTVEEKEKRAEEIAEKLSRNSLWHSHGRYIGINTIKDELRLEIEDYTNITELRNSIILYNNLLTEFVAKNNRAIFFHSNI